jgi:hypothetical protein
MFCLQDMDLHFAFSVFYSGPTSLQASNTDSELLFTVRKFPPK